MSLFCTISILVDFRNFSVFLYFRTNLYFENLFLSIYCFSFGVSSTLIGLKTDKYDTKLHYISVFILDHIIIVEPQLYKKDFIGSPIRNRSPKLYFKGKLNEWNWFLTLLTLCSLVSISADSNDAMLGNVTHHLWLISFAFF